MSTNDNMDDSGCILDFGVATAVNHESRRDINNEINEIVKSMRVTKGEIENETEVRSKLEQDKRRAKDDVGKMLTAANDGTENVKMNQHVLGNLQSTYNSDFASADFSKSVASWRHALVEKKAAIQSTKDKLQSLQATAKNVRAETNQWNEKIDEIQKTAATDQIKVALANALHLAREMEDALEQEKKRLAAIQAKRAAIEASNKKTKAKLVEKAEQLKKAKADQAAKESDMQKRLDASKASYESKVQELSNLKKQSNEFQQSRATLQGYLNEGRALISKRKSTQNELLAQRETRKKLSVEAENLRNIITELKNKTSTKQDELEDKQRELKKLTDLENALDSTKLVAELEAKTKHILELEEAIKATKSNELNTNDLDEKQEELEQLNQDIAKAVREADQLSKKLLDLEAARENETQEHKDRVDSMEAELESKKTVTAEEYKICSRRNKILKHAESMLDKTAKEEEGA